MPDNRFLPGILTAYFLLVYLVILGIAGSFMKILEGAGMYAKGFAAIAVLAYALLYLLPALVLTASLYLALSARTGPATWKTLCVCASACLSGTGTVLFLAADRYLFSLYGYHFNASVWNLIISPGGSDSLGSTFETKLWLFAAVSLLFAANSGVLWLLCTRQGWHRFSCSPKRYLFGAVIVLALAFFAEEGGYAYALFTHDEQTLKAASIIPLHLNTTATTLFKRFGVQRPPMQERIRIAQGKISYPAQPLSTKPLAKYPNIVWLTAESFRWDLFNPEITPNLWKFSRRAVTFNRHYSGGDRTRMGMFSMFYGLYAPYWYGFQEQKIRPQLMQQVVDHNYQLAINTSQSFSYPELKDTLFTGIPAANLQELQDGPAWERDHRNISDISRFIQTRDTRRPFFTFMFFESTHAPYTFPDAAVIRPDYLPEVNYLQMGKITGDIRPLHDRYINAAHHVDAEVGRLFDLLDKEHLLDDTIVLFTGDHGEEFMENGHWGHGHNEVFPEQQIRVPLVLWIPGQQPRQVDYPTSHNQIPATLLPYLGVTSPARDYSSEDGLFTGPQPYRVVGSYDYLGIVDPDSKLSFPFTTADYFHYIVSDASDSVLPLLQQQQLLPRKQKQLDEVVEECRRFTMKNQGLALNQ
ncbi:MAG: DUF3413 domain-containing protein [Desulfuromonas sp.]|nr:DUF3413 domain-containing protein [Desulfuromonas sp.]